MKVASIALLALSTVSGSHVPNNSVTAYNLCIHNYDCIEGLKCCQAVMSGGDGVMLLRCGPWLDYSGYTGAINGYMYKCEDDQGAKHLYASAAALALVAASMF